MRIWDTLVRLSAHGEMLDFFQAGCQACRQSLDSGQGQVTKLSLDSVSGMSLWTPLPQLALVLGSLLWSTMGLM